MDTQAKAAKHQHDSDLDVNQLRYVEKNAVPLVHQGASLERSREKCFQLGMTSRSADDVNYYPRRACCNLAAYPIVRWTYCEQHRKILSNSDNSREQSSCARSEHYEFSADESLVNSLESSSSIHRRPTTSCLKNLTSTESRAKSNERRVYFAEGTRTYESSVDSDGYGEQSRKHGATAIVRNPHVTESSSEQRTTMSTPEVTQSLTSALEASSSSHRSENPRVVKPRDVLRRPSTRKMIIYPPEGQRGEPMSLSKKWSKIQCRVSGNEDTGFRYKVYYLQTFESDKWLANSKTNGPFQSRDEPDDSTDCIN